MIGDLGNPLVLWSGQNLTPLSVSNIWIISNDGPTLWIFYANNTQPDLVYVLKYDENLDASYFILDSQLSATLIPLMNYCDCNSGMYNGFLFILNNTGSLLKVPLNGSYEIECVASIGFNTTSEQAWITIGRSPRSFTPVVAEGITIIILDKTSGISFVYFFNASSNQLETVTWVNGMVFSVECTSLAIGPMLWIGGDFTTKGIIVITRESCVFH